MKEEKSVYLRKDGRYEIRYAYALKENGRKKYKSIYGKTKMEVKKKYKKIIENNNLILLEKNTLTKDIELWLKSVKIRCKKSTYTNYEYTVNARILSKFSKIKKKNINEEIINEFKEELLNDGLLPKTVKDILIILKQILKFAHVNISVTMPKVPKNEIQIFTKDEQRKLEKKLFENMNLNTFGVFFCLYTGLRIGELCALQWENIDIKNKKIKVKKTITRIKNFDDSNKKKTLVILDEPKSLSSIREIPIPDFIISKLRIFSKDVDPKYFLITGSEKMMETRTYFNCYKKVLKSIHLENYNFHALRHTFATRCIENGCDPKTLSEILGHSNVKITLDRYVHPNYENKVKMMNQLKPMYK